jgi:RNA polymerase sigma factor (sigma-70 family)
VHLPPFQALVDEHRQALWRYLVAAVGHHDAGDCFQETMVSALRAYPSLQHDTNLAGWLFTIAHRKVIDQARVRERQPVPVGAVPDRAGPGEADTDESDLWAAVARLTPAVRSAVVLRYVADRPYAEIGDILGCSAAAARQRVHSGLETLREEFQP